MKGKVGDPGAHDVPFFPSGIVGYKVLAFRKATTKLADDDMVLVSPYYPSLRWWPTGLSREEIDPGVMKAYCRTTRRPYHRTSEGDWAPKIPTGHTAFDESGEHCQCGLYAYHTLRNVYDNYPAIRPLLTKSTSHVTGVAGKPVLALVWGYGKLFYNEVSARYERMRFAALCDRGPVGIETLGEIAQTLGVPLMGLEEMEDFAKEAGIHLGKEENA